MAVLENGDGNYVVNGKLVVAKGLSPEMRSQLDSQAVSMRLNPVTQATGVLGDVNNGIGVVGEGIRRAAPYIGQALSPTIVQAAEPPQPAAGQPQAQPQPQTQQQSQDQLQANETQPQSVAAGAAGAAGASGLPMITQTTTHGAAKLGASDWRALEASEKAKEKAITGMAEAKAESAAKMNEVYAEQQQQMAQQAAEMRDAEAQRQTAYDAKMGEVDTAVKDLQNTHLDPRRKWNSLDTGRRVGVSISMALGAFGAALTHGPNTAKEIWDKSVNDDIEAQRDEIAKKKDIVGLKNNQLAQLMQKGLNDRQAEAALRMQKAQGMEMQIKSIMSLNDSKEAQASGQIMLAGAKQDYENAHAQLKLATQDRVDTTKTPDTTGITAGKKADELTFSVPVYDKDGKRVGDRQFVAKSPEEKKELTKKIDDLEAIRREVTHYNNLLDSPGSNKTGTKAKEIFAAQERLANLYAATQAKGGRAPSETEIEIGRHQMADATSLKSFFSDPKKMANRLKENAQADLMSTLVSGGYVNGQKK